MLLCEIVFYLTVTTSTMNQNFNSNTSEQYSLHVSNDQIELNLPPNELSCASNFEVNLTPTLDLNQLSYLQSTDVEVSYLHDVLFYRNKVSHLFDNFFFLLFTDENCGALSGFKPFVSSPRQERSD